LPNASIDHVVDSAEDAEVTVGSVERAVAAQERPAVPILAVRIGVVLRAVGLDEPFVVAPDRLQQAGHRLRMQMLPATPLPAATTLRSSSYRIG
jgi:hypothetical protein